MKPEPGRLYELQPAYAGDRTLPRLLRLHATWKHLNAAAIYPVPNGRAVVGLRLSMPLHLFRACYKAVGKSQEHKK